MSDDSAAIRLPREMLDEMGVLEGDEVDVSVSDGTLIMRSLDAERAARSTMRGTLYLNTERSLQKTCRRN